jgi:DNA-binding NarL/FixJ family response regulator
VDLLSDELRTHHPDILLIDHSSGFTFNVLHTLQAAAARTKIILWVTSIPTELALQAMGFGIRGILSKTASIDSLLRCLRSVGDGELWFEKNLTESIMSAGRYSLTRREGQLVSLLAQGLKNRDIAAALGISEGTVKVYLSKLFHKLGVKDRLELALYGVKNLTPGGPGLQSSSGTPWQTPRSFFVERSAPRVEQGN